MYLNRGTFILLVFYVPFALIPFAFGEKIFLAIGQDAEVAHLAAIQVKYQLPQILFAGLFDLNKRWLSCLRITFVPSVAMAIATVFHIVLCYVLLYVEGMGIKGLAIASSIKDGVLLSIVMIYMRCSKKISQIMTPIAISAFTNWCEYLKVSIPCTVMLCAEWYAFEIVTVLAGVLGVNEIACQTVVFSIAALTAQVAIGLQEATCALIGNCIGANNIPLAKRFFSMITKVTLAIIMAFGLLLYFFRDQLAELFTDGDE